MRRFLIIGLLLTVAHALCAQGWTAEDSLHVRKLLDSEGEMHINPEVLKELEMNHSWGTPQVDAHKSWMEFDTSLPTISQEPKKKIHLTLRPYTTTTKYNWDPVYKKKIKIDRDTWRGDPFCNIATGWKKKANPPAGTDLMAIFTKDFWDTKGCARRSRTLEVLRGYGDSTTVLINHLIYPR